nr:PREDICTED: predicted GPI-anchored protein 58 [Bemisia tabaci]
MKVFVVLVSALVAYAEGAAIGAPMAMMRAPQFDSATIEHERLGGNFAYKTMEAHAYAAVSPVIENVPTQVGVSYAHRPIFGQVTYHEPAQATVITAPVAVPAAAPVYATPVAAAPVYPAAAPIYAPAPVAAPLYPAAPAFPAADSPSIPAQPSPAFPAQPSPAQPAPAAPAQDAPSFPSQPSPAFPAQDAPSFPSQPSPSFPAQAGAPSQDAPAQGASSDDDSITVESA